MSDVLKVFVSSTSEDLKANRAAAGDVIRDLGWQYVGMEHFGTDPEPIVAACRRLVGECDLVILLQAFRRGWVPSQEEGGDGKTSITAFEIRAADELGKPVLALLAAGTWPGNLWEEDQVARAWVSNFRNGLNRMASFFEPESERLDSFRALLRQELVRHKERILGRVPTAVTAEVSAVTADVQLRPACPPEELPETPYPLLEPYRHPGTFAGREQELDELCRLLRRDKLVVCVHAASGAGKSSLLLAGLAPKLRSEGVPVSIVRHPGEPQIAQRLVADLLELPEGTAVADEAPGAFAEWVRNARDLAGMPPVLVLDQLDDVLRNRSVRNQVLARLGPLMAATAQRLPGLQGPPCRWLLCYRHEFHGEVVEWLGDVLAEARREGRKGLDILPHDLGDAERLLSWPLPVMGKPAPGEEAAGAASQPFLSALREPLLLESAPGKRRYPVRFANDGAERLAQAFASARATDPEAPLVPELQVVLAYLLACGAEQTEGEVVVDVPKESDQLEALIVDALEGHVRRALIDAFPAGTDPVGTRRGRARALLALCELADAEGRRGQGLPEEALVRALGEGGAEVLEKLASPTVRVILKEEKAGAFGYALSHDCMAEVVARLVEDESLRRDLEVDSELLNLRQFVAQRAELFLGSHDPSALDLPAKQYRIIEQSADALLWGEDHRRWWEKCRQRRRVQRRAWSRRVALVLVGLILIVAGVGLLATKLRMQKSQKLAAESLLMLDTDPESSLRLAFQSAEMAQSRDAKQALHASLAASIIRKLWSIPLGPASAVAFSPDGEEVAAGGVRGHGGIWDVETGKLLRSFSDHGSPVMAIGYTEGGELLVTADYDGLIVIRDATTGSTRNSLTQLQKRVHLYDMSLSPDGQTLAIAVLEDTGRPQVVLLDLTPLTVETEPSQELVVPIRTLPAVIDEGEEFMSVDYSAGGDYLGVAGSDGRISVWNVESGRHLCTTEKLSAEIYSVAFSADGKSFAAGAGDYVVRRWSLEDCLSSSSPEEAPEIRPIERFVGHRGEVALDLADAYSVVGSHLVTASMDGTISLWVSGQDMHLYSRQTFESQLKDLATFPSRMASEPVGDTHFYIATVSAGINAEGERTGSLTLWAEGPPDDIQKLKLDQAEEADFKELVRLAKNWLVEEKDLSDQLPE